MTVVTSFKSEEITVPEVKAPEGTTYAPCNVKNMTTWIEALESGDYEQGKSALKMSGRKPDTFAYCCLGVGAEVCDLPYSFVLVPESDADGDEPEWHYDGKYDEPGDEFYQWLGVEHLDKLPRPVVTHIMDDGTPGFSTERSLIDLNDNFGYSFAQIARLLREHFGIFKNNVRTKYPELNRANVKTWIEALESGEYQQTRGTLHRLVPSGATPAGYCCLGVACRISPIFGVLRDGSERMAYDGATGVLPQSVIDWLGLGVDEVEQPRVSLEVLTGDGARRSLTNLNDGGEYDFTQIAAALRVEFDMPKEDEL